MKQLFIDLLTKQIPSSANPYTLIYTFKYFSDVKDTISVSIYPKYFSKDISIKIGLREPFSDTPGGCSIPLNDHTIKKYCMNIDRIEYVIDLTSEEILNVDLLFHKIFKTYQLKNINYVKSQIKNIKEKEDSPEEKFEQAQQAIADGYE